MSTHFHDLPSAFHTGFYQLVDLYGEGIPGILYSEGDSHYYRAPQRAQQKTEKEHTALASVYNDAATYAQAWSLLDPVPVGGLNLTTKATLMDITGDGQLDYVVPHAGWRRQEIYGLGSIHPYEVSESRYKARLIEEAQPYSVYFISLLEQLNYYYKRVPQDPRCTHEITLAQDAYGFIQHQLSVSYPRRTPLPEPLEYQDEQQCYLRCSEKYMSWIHLIELDGYRLGLAAEEKNWEYCYTPQLLIETNWLSGIIFSYEQCMQNNA